MAVQRVRPTTQFRGRPQIPGDKSVSHRALIFGALANGTTEVHNLLESADVQSTASCLRQLGVQIFEKNGLTYVKSEGPESFHSPKNILDCGNSGTTIRLMMGVLAGLNSCKATLTGDASLVKRPMKRVAEPLREMGAKIDLTNTDFAPVTVTGTQLQGINYDLKIASAQIKTAIVLAAIFSRGITSITGEIHSRDHTERLLGHFGVRIRHTPIAVQIEGGQKFTPNRLNVPSDPSTAAFWLAAAALIPGSELELQDISMNPTRTGFLTVLQKMGAQIETQVTENQPEPIGDIRVTHGPLKGVIIEPQEVPTLIDELPMLAVLATQALGITEVKGAEELRVKETDRIEAIAKNLRAMGAKIETRPDGFIIEGPQPLKGAEIDSFHDHRIAMAFSIGTLIAKSESVIHGAECVSISYPDFFSTLAELT